MPVSWTVERAVGSAGELHARAVPDPATRAVWVLEVDRPALVLGSAQPAESVDAAAAARAGVEVVRRRSGGGAVLLLPGDAVWIDVVVPAGDPLWVADVGRAGLWLGEAWVRALAACGVTGTRVHDGPMVHSRWSRQVCFAGRGPGEVLLGSRKVVGVSQRRTRAGARFQCVAHRRWDPAAIVPLLAPPRPTVADLRALAAEVGPACPLEQALLAALPS